ncbi:MAG TPA: DUF4253 domain-containing protein [Tepidisphaeraceae bacterium]|jgi:hypothetical protein|nr:DUF4253 domain-containing protein [Tepidisphaeraceae bacterium]
MEWINTDLLQSAGIDPSAMQEHGSHVVTVAVPGGKPAVEQWHRLAAEASELGGYAVLRGDPKRSDEEEIPAEQEVAQTLATVPAGPPLAALRDAKSAGREQALEHLRNLGNEALLEKMKLAYASKPTDTPAPDFSLWPKEPPDQSRRSLHSAFDFRRKPLERCELAIVRARHPADLVAYLGFGGFNDCPAPALHVAFLRDWNRRFGAVPAVITHDVIELFVPRPIVDPREAFAVAKDQYDYCGDIVDQGTETVERLARAIWGSPYWFFWWD